MITPSNRIRISTEEQIVLAVVGNGSTPHPPELHPPATQREERSEVAIIAVLADGGVELNANDTIKEWFSLLFFILCLLPLEASKIRLLLCERMC
jgi:hypothetical protein